MKPADGNICTLSTFSGQLSFCLPFHFKLQFPYCLFLVHFWLSWFPQQALSSFATPQHCIRIRPGSAGKHWPEVGRMIIAHRLASGPDPSGQNMTQSARTKSDPGWFCTILSGTSVEERNRVWKWETGSGPVASSRTRRFLHTNLLPGQMRFAKPWPGHPDRIQVGFAQYNPCLFGKNGAEMDAGSRIQHIQTGPILAARWP